MKELVRWLRRHFTEVVVVAIFALIIVGVAVAPMLRSSPHGGIPSLSFHRVAFRDLRPGALIRVTHSSIADGAVVVKVLKVDPDGVHVKVVSGLGDVSTKAGSIQMDGMHLPLSRDTWETGSSTVIGHEQVTSSELSGYRQWKADHGGYF
jgi:hypothetical protein